MDTHRDALWIIYDRGQTDFKKLLDLHPELVHDQNLDEDSSATLLHWACGLANTVAVGELLARGAEVNIQSASGYTPLHCAVNETLDPFIIDLLMSKGADPEIADYGGYTPLMTVSARGCDLAILCAERLIRAGAQIDLNSAVILRDVEFVKEMVESHPQGIHQATHPNNLLYSAIVNHDIKMVDYLITKGADVNAPTLSGNPPLYHALGRDADADIVRLLLQSGADPNLQSRSGDRVLSIAQVTLTNDVVLQLLKEHGALE